MSAREKTLIIDELREECRKRGSWSKSIAACRGCALAAPCDLVRRQTPGLGERFRERLWRKNVERPAECSSIENLHGAAVVGTHEQQATLRCLGKDHSKRLVGREQCHHFAAGVHRLESLLLEKAV